MSHEETLTINGLELKFPKFKLGPLEMHVPSGAMYGFIGPNGAGKTTTLKLIMGMGMPDAGKIKVFGLDHLEEEVAVKKEIGFVCADLNFASWGKVKRLIRFIREFYEDWDDGYCDALLERFGIDMSDRIATLSTGTYIKLNLVLALAHRPRLLLLDEPLAGLDAVAKRQVFDELLEAIQDERRTVLISSHNLADLERYADHIGILNRGYMIAEGATSALVERFRMMDATVADGALAGTEGVYGLEQDGSRARFMLDIEVLPVAALARHGAKKVMEARLTLEEVFVNLVARK
jgi:ABC-2 type transport system ATP-binding protein